MPEELPLEPDLIKVLAADTRRDILSLLQDRRMTVTELSRELELGKATVHEHLDKLTEAGLVERQEDDRLWVYYRLTGRGKRLLNPQRTRFYLALASAVVAALVTGLAVYGFVMTGGIGPGGGPPADEAAQAPEMAVMPTDAEVYAGDAIEVPARIQGGDDVQAYLVDEDSASRIRQGDLGVEGLPLRAYSPSSDTAGEVQARDETTLLRSDATLPPGTYYLYVRGDAGDNAASMPAVRLVGLEADADLSTWYQGVDEGPLRIELTREGEPVDGTMRLAGGPRAGTSPSAPVDEGTVNLTASTLDDLRAGTYRVSVQPDDADRWIRLPTTITVRPASLAVLPQHVPEGDPSIRVQVGGPDRLRSTAPSIAGAPASLEAQDEGWWVRLDGAEPGTVSVDLARTSTPIGVHPTVGVRAEVHDGPEVRWTLTGPDGEPVSDAAVYIDGRSRGFTDADGTLVTGVPDEGVHRLSIHRPDGQAVTRTVSVDGWRIANPSPSLTVAPIDVSSEHETARITVEVTNPDTAPRPATIVAHVDGTPGAAKGLTVPAQGTTRANLTVPVDAGRQPVTVQVHGLAQGPFTYVNETTDAGADDRDSGTANETDGAEGGGAAADTETTDASSTTVEVPGEEAFEAEQVADGEASPLEPVRPTDGAAGDAEVAEGVEAPAVGPLAVAVVVGLVAVLGVRSRKP